MKTGNSINKNQKYYFIFLLIFVLVSCKGAEKIPPQLNSDLKLPKINLLVPNKGSVGEIIKIIGENFGKSKEDITINFGSLKIKALDFSETMVTFEVPDLAGENLVSISVNHQESNSRTFVCIEKSSEKAKMAILDKEICYVNNTNSCRTIPKDPNFYYFSDIPSIPRVQSVPFEWGSENFYSGNRGYITENVYKEPDKPWILQLCISTPGVGDTQSGSPQYKTWYRTSSDNGKTFTPLKQVIIDGYSNMNPIKGVEIGRNGFNVDFTRPIVRSTNGEIMVPIGLHPWDDNNKKIYLPISGAYMFQDAGVLIGHWLPDGNDMLWEFGDWLRIDYNKSTRGLSEPTIVQINNQGRFAMICRGSNLARLDLPCYAWVSFSDDFCRTWNDPVPLTYSNGDNFYVTTAHSTLFKSKVNGKTYWIGNLTKENPRASFPRYPLVIGEIDLIDFGLIKETVLEIDTKQPFDGEQVQLSNFSILENKVSPEIIIVLTRFEGGESASNPSWYRIKLN